MFCTDLGLILGLVGATGSTAVSYVFPGIFYFKLRKNGYKRYLGLLLFIMGLILIPLGVTVEILGSLGKI